MNAIVVVILAFVLSGCASNSSAVRCDGRLEPINTPAPALARDAGSTRPPANEKGTEDGS
jgi:hypothetical protein